MAKTILGKWETDQEHGKNKDFEKYHTAMGLESETREQYGKMKETLEYLMDGDGLICNVIMEGNIVKTYSGLKEGKEERLMGIDGKPFFYCFRTENGVFVETYKPDDGKNIVIETTKVVKGNQMTITHTVKNKGVSYSYTLTKQ